MKKNNHSIFPLIWVMLFDHTSLNITFPILTLLFFDLQSNLFPADTSMAVRSMWYGLCVAIPHVVNIVAAPALSALSDGFGRKKILLVGTFGAFLFAITAALGVMWGMLSILFLGRIIQGLFSRTNPIAQAVIGDISSKGKKVIYMGYLQTAISIGAFIGPVIGGYFANRYWFETFNFSLPYFIAALFAAVSCLLTWFVFRETLIVKQSRSPWRELNWHTIKKVFTNPSVTKISAVLLLTQVSWSIYYQFVPPTLKTVFHFNANQLGLFIGLIAFWLALATTIGIKVLDYFFDMHQMLVISVYLVLLGLVLTLVFCFFYVSGQSAWPIWAAAAPIAIGDVVAYSCLTALYSDVVEPEEQGKVMGVCFIIVALIWALTGALGGVMMSISTLFPLFFAPLGIGAAIILLHVGMLRCS